jgi:hypothetical protein
MIKYLYIDDRKNGKQAIQNFPIKDKLDIDVVVPTEKISGILKLLKNYDGLIVDQQLDEDPIINGTQCDFLGSTLAAQIRAKENEVFLTGKDISIPIILYSANENAPKTFVGLELDFFDFMIFKSEFEYQDFKNKIPMYQAQMISLVNGYNKLKEVASICDSLYINNLDIIDSRFIFELKRRENHTAHSKASFILNELIIKQGILIDEDILAVRLGIDKNESTEGWVKVRDSLKDFGVEYQGVFSDGWPRWWMPMVDEWWYSLIDNDTYIRFYNAEQRAKLISEKLGGIQLVPAKAKSRYSIHNEYWTICDFSKEPLDIEDGLLLPGQEDLYPWQDAKYVSIQSALDESIEVAECEKKKLESFKTEK